MIPGLEEPPSSRDLVVYTAGMVEVARFPGGATEAQLDALTDQYGCLGWRPEDPRPTDALTLADLGRQPGPGSPV